MMKLFEDRESVVKYIKDRRGQGAKVIDFGGGLHSWTYGFVDAVADLFPEGVDKNIKTYKTSFNEPVSYAGIEKYDISICSHTLEDIRAPHILLDEMQKLSAEGFILVPSSFEELSYMESFEYLGYCHHRWIYTFDGSHMVIYAKMANLNYFYGISTFYKKIFGSKPKIAVLKKWRYPIFWAVNFLFKKRFKHPKKFIKRRELILYWNNKIDYKFNNDDFMLSGGDMVLWYNNLLLKDKNLEIHA